MCYTYVYCHLRVLSHVYNCLSHTCIVTNVYCHLYVRVLSLTCTCIVTNTCIVTCNETQYMYMYTTEYNVHVDLMHLVVTVHVCALRTNMPRL